MEDCRWSEVVDDLAPLQADGKQSHWRNYRTGSCCAEGGGLPIAVAMPTGIPAVPLAAAPGAAFTPDMASCTGMRAPCLHGGTESGSGYPHYGQQRVPAPAAATFQVPASAAAPATAQGAAFAPQIATAAAPVGAPQQPPQPQGAPDYAATVPLRAQGTVPAAAVPPFAATVDAAYGTPPYATASGAGPPVPGLPPFGTGAVHDTRPFPGAHPAYAAQAGVAGGVPMPVPNSKTGKRRTAAELEVDLQQRVKVLRTPSHIGANCNLTQVPVGFPLGPIPGNMKQLQEHVNLFTSNVRSGAGGFGVTRTRAASQCKTKGDVLWLQCVCQTKGCQWRTKWEESTDGWMLVEYKAHVDPQMDAEGRAIVHAPGVPTANEHNHPLLLDAAQVSSHTIQAVMRATHATHAQIIMFLHIVCCARYAMR